MCRQAGVYACETAGISGNSCIPVSARPFTAWGSAALENRHVQPAAAVFFYQLFQALAHFFLIGRASNVRMFRRICHECIHSMYDVYYQRISLADSQLRVSRLVADAPFKMHACAEFWIRQVILAAEIRRKVSSPVTGIIRLAFCTGQCYGQKEVIFFGKLAFQLAAAILEQAVFCFP